MSKNSEITVDLPPAGVVLAGGGGTRVEGRDKGWLRWQGTSLIESVLERFQRQVGALAISANRNIDAYQALGYPVLQDEDDFGLEPYQGPLLGLYSALKWCPQPWLACIPCDVPRLPEDLVTRLADGLNGGMCAYARDEQRAHYLCCLLHCSLASNLEDYLRREHRAVRHWFGEIGAIEVDFGARSQEFININHNEQLDAEQE